MSSELFLLDITQVIVLCWEMFTQVQTCWRCFTRLLYFDFSNNWVLKMSKYVETTDIIHPSLDLIVHSLFTITCGDPCCNIASSSPLTFRNKYLLIPNPMVTQTLKQSVNPQTALWSSKCPHKAESPHNAAMKTQSTQRYVDKHTPMHTIFIQTKENGITRHRLPHNHITEECVCVCVCVCV